MVFTGTRQLLSRAVYSNIFLHYNAGGNELLLLSRMDLEFNKRD